MSLECLVDRPLDPLECLVDRPLDPPSRAVLLYLSHLCFSGIAGYHAIAPKFALSQPKGEGGRGYRNSSCLLEGIALYGGIDEIVSRVAA